MWIRARPVGHFVTFIRWAPSPEQASVQLQYGLLLSKLVGWSLQHGLQPHPHKRRDYCCRDAFQRRDASCWWGPWKTQGGFAHDTELENVRISPVSQLAAGPGPQQEEKPPLSNHRWYHFSCACSTEHTQNNICPCIHSIHSPMSDRRCWRRLSWLLHSRG